MDTTHQHTPTATGYDANDRCCECGEHIADPHAPECPQGQFEDDLAAHASAVLAGEFTTDDLLAIQDRTNRANP